MRKKLAIVWNWTDSGALCGLPPLPGSAGGSAWDRRPTRRCLDSLRRGTVWASLPTPNPFCSHSITLLTRPRPAPRDPSTTRQRHVAAAGPETLLLRPATGAATAPVRAARNSAPQTLGSARHSPAPTPLPLLVHICGDSAVLGKAPTAAVTPQAQRQLCAPGCL